MSEAAEIELNVQQYTSFTDTWTWTDEDDNPFDLSAYKAAMQVREDYTSSTTKVDLTTENGGITLGGAAGTITIYISSTVTSTFPSDGRWKYDLNLILISDATNRPPFARGDFIVVPGVTR